MHWQTRTSARGTPTSAATTRSVTTSTPPTRVLVAVGTGRMGRVGLASVRWLGRVGLASVRC